MKGKLNIPNVYICQNKPYVDGIAVIFILLKRASYPIQFKDLLPRFALPEIQISMIAGEVTNYVYLKYRHRLYDFNQAWFSQLNHQAYIKIFQCAGALVIGLSLKQCHHSEPNYAYILLFQNHSF